MVAPLLQCSSFQQVGSQLAVSALALELWTGLGQPQEQTAMDWTAACNAASQVKTSKDEVLLSRLVHSAGYSTRIDEHWYITRPEIWATNTKADEHRPWRLGNESHGSYAHNSGDLHTMHGDVSSCDTALHCCNMTQQAAQASAGLANLAFASQSQQTSEPWRMFDACNACPASAQSAACTPGQQSQRYVQAVTIGCGESPDAQCGRGLHVLMCCTGPSAESACSAVPDTCSPSSNEPQDASSELPLAIESMCDDKLPSAAWHIRMPSAYSLQSLEWHHSDDEASTWQNGIASNLRPAHPGNVLSSNASVPGLLAQRIRAHIIKDVPLPSAMSVLDAKWHAVDVSDQMQLSAALHVQMLVHTSLSIQSAWDNIVEAISFPLGSALVWSNVVP
jgi:hypothetical protein